ncbi:hypothetical protein FQN54_000774 [Arachnomyces sp. PD_36]|nr:hypothetical protein FQN54_000774 [Arachnomyces sp. PD_36]
MGFTIPSSLKALALSAIFLPALVSAVEPDPVFDVPIFNNPPGTEAEQYTIYQQLARIIDRVPDGESIEMSWFEFKVDYTTDTADKPNIPARLVKAHKRGVEVRIILDGNVKEDGTSNADYAPWQELLVLGAVITNSEHLLLCPDKEGCIGERVLYGNTYAYNHNKFLTASKILLNDYTEIENVVFQSSGNLGTWDADTAWNNAISWSEEASYNDYRAYYSDLNKYIYPGYGVDDYYRVGDSSEKYKTHFFPRKETNGDLNQASTDTIVEQLDLVKCSYTGETDGKVHQTDIRILMWQITRVAVAEKLADLVRDGCWVDIVYADPNINDAVESAIGAVDDGENMGWTACSVDFEGRNLRPHSKYMLIDGQFGDDQEPRVFMGSHNYAMSALRSADEALVRIKGREVHDAYLKNFYQARDTCSGKIQPGE